jgi:tRNA pseudouridine32 synthase/23S rRNA pseudouridine746 synthase
MSDHTPDIPPGLTIIQATDRYVVIDKSVGLLSVPGKGESKQDCAAARVRKHFPRATGPLVVHRLDMDTSGLMVFALDTDAQRELSAQFEARTVFKQYIALVDGVLPAESGEIELPMRLDVDRRPLQIIDHEHGRPSLTYWSMLAIETDRSRVLLTPHTGRTHQLRVHLAALGHPILGDVLYGPQPRTATLAPRLCLHASALTFSEPGTTMRSSFTSPAPF